MEANIEVNKIIEQCAKEHAIAFAQWIYKDWYKWGSDGLWWSKVHNTGGYTTDELYEKYLKSKRVINGKLKVRELRLDKM